MSVRRSHPAHQSQKPAAATKRPAGHHNGGASVAFSDGSGGEAAASLDTEVLTQRGKTRRGHNPTAKRLRILTSRTEWLADVAAATTVVREQSARKLEERGRALALDRRRIWREGSAGKSTIRVGNQNAGFVSGCVQPPELALHPLPSWAPESVGGRPAGFVPSGMIARAERTGRAAEGPEYERADRHASSSAAPVATRWHSSRAQSKREIFERVAKCGEDDKARITLVCRGCKDATSIEVGCGSQWFCSDCRAKQAAKFRKTFERHRLGLTTIAERAGLTRRRQRRGDRWGEKLLTVTLPHRGDAAERIEVLHETWARFWRVLRDRLRPELQGPSGITLSDVPRGFPKKFEKRDDPNELKLWDVLSYLHVTEWTPGDDGQGHPHIHAWLFSRFLDQAMVKRLWEGAHRHVLRARLDRDGKSGPVEQCDLIVDIRAAAPDVARELVKYLTKDWEISGEGAKRAAPEVFARVYATLDGKRRRQSSAGLSMWAVEQFNACPCCGFERERGHWARIDIEHGKDEKNVKRRLGRAPRTGYYLHWAADEPDDPLNGTYQPMVGGNVGDYELRERFEAERDLAWLESCERRTVRARMQTAGFEVEAETETAIESEEDREWQKQIELW